MYALQSYPLMLLCILESSLALLRRPSRNTSTSGLRVADSGADGVVSDSHEREYM